jgi:hypothetical protein
LSVEVLSGDFMRENAPIISDISRVRRQWTPTQVRDYIAALPIWNEPVEIRQKFGGLTNRTYFAYVEDRPKFAIRGRHPSSSARSLPTSSA